MIGDENQSHHTGVCTYHVCAGVCPVGQYLLGGACALCEVGTFRDNQLQENCTVCPDGLLTPNRGAISSNDCSKSRFTDLIYIIFHYMFKKYFQSDKNWNR